MDGQDVFEWGVQEGLVKKDVLEAFEINNVQYESDVATATLLKNGRPVNDLVFTFHKEGDGWKLDLANLLPAEDPALDQLRQQTGRKKLELAIFLLERTYGETIPPNILNGPLK